MSARGQRSDVWNWRGVGRPANLQAESASSVRSKKTCKSNFSRAGSVMCVLAHLGRMGHNTNE